MRSILEDSPPPIPTHYSQGIKQIASALLIKDMDKRMGMAGVWGILELFMEFDDGVCCVVLCVVVVVWCVVQL